MGRMKYQWNHLLYLKKRSRGVYGVVAGKEEAARWGHRCKFTELVLTRYFRHVE